MNPAQPVLTVNLAALRENYTILQARLAPGCRMSAVVKANGYGLGAARLVDSFKSLKCNDYFVFTPEEGIELRAVLPDSRIYILNGFPAGWGQAYISHNFIPCIGSIGALAAWQAEVVKAGRKLPAAIQFDTGMNRLGLGAAEAQRLIGDPDLLKGLDLKLVMSHFACADEKDSPETKAQFEKFSALAKHFPNVEKSLGNSSGIFRSHDFHFDLARPGMALYGLNPTPESKNPMQPVAALHVPVLQTRTAERGDFTGYSATHRFEKKTALATLWLGYADGFLRSLSSKGVLYWKNYPCPIRGRVSMDLVTISLENVPEKDWPREGDMIEVLGPNQGADDLAEAAGTIGYEILTSLGHRYRREYTG